MSRQILPVPPVAPSTTSPSYHVTFGDATSAPIRITDADFHLYPFVRLLNHTVVSLTLAIVNEQTPGSITGKLKIELPDTATVSKFEFERLENEDDKTKRRWYPACPLAVKKAQEVVYREREKGREVAAASQASGNRFEIEVFPLPQNETLRCRVWWVQAGASMGGEGVHRFSDFQNMFDFGGAECRVEVIGEDVAPNDTALDHVDEENRCLSAEVNGETHFACYVPPVPPAPAGAEVEGQFSASDVSRIVLLWDTSQSQRTNLQKNRLAKLRALATALPSAVFDVWFFDVFPKCVATSANIETVAEALEKNVVYDGATDLQTVVDTVLAEYGSDISFSGDSTDKVDKTDSSKKMVCLLFSDGQDSLGAGNIVVPEVFASSGGSRLYCVAAKGTSGVNIPLLRGLAHSGNGRLIEESEAAASQNNLYVDFILERAPILTKIETDQSVSEFQGEQWGTAVHLDGDFALLNEVSDPCKFVCVPDHRLATHALDLGKEGLIVSGILGKESSVSTIVAHISDGRRVRFQLGSSLIQDEQEILQEEQDEQGKEDHDEGTRTRPHHNLVAIQHLLGFLFARAQYEQVQRDSARMGLPFSLLHKQLALTYNFCSPEASLVMLYEVAQFTENDVVCPVGHPNHAEWAECIKVKKAEAEKFVVGNGIDSANNVGVLKNPPEIGEEKGNLGAVERLVCTLRDYMAAPDFGRTPRRPPVGEGGGSGWFRESRGMPGGPDRGMGGARRNAPRMGGPPMGMAARSTDGAPPMMRAARSLQSNQRMMFNGPPAAGNDNMMHEIESSMEMLSGAAPSMDMAMMASSPCPWKEEEQEEVFCGAVMGMDEDEDESGLEECGAAPMDEDNRGARRRRLGDEREDGGGFLSKTKEAEDGKPAPTPFSQSNAEEYMKQLREACVRVRATATSADDSLPVPGLPGDKNPCLPDLREEPLRTYLSLRDGDGDHPHRTSPSFYLYAAAVLLENGFPELAIRVCSNCLELDVRSGQMLRCVGYFLLKATGLVTGVSALALRVFERVKDLAPLEPQTYLDCALARLRMVFQGEEAEVCCGTGRG